MTYREPLMYREGEGIIDLPSTLAYLNPLKPRTGHYRASESVYDRQARPIHSGVCEEW